MSGRICNVKKDCMIFSIAVLLLLSLKIGIVEGTSMVPTLSNNSAFIYTSYLNEDRIKKFDVVVIHDTINNLNLVKRVIGTPGSMVYQYKGNVIGVDNLYLPNISLNEHELKEVEIYVVPPNNIFYVGDNQDNSIDSRHKGFLPTEDVIGKVVWGW